VGPGDLSRLLDELPRQISRRLLVGAEHSDDAAVYRISDDVALVSTIDFFPPIVDDPFTYGQIAAANALSDVYAMGGMPVLALNVVCFPTKRLPMTLLAKILAGGAERVAAAGAVVGGGHSVCDTEMKYGLAVQGIVAPGEVIRNGGARKRDLLVLTKPLGTGIVASAIKRGAAEPAEEKAATASMVALNEVAGAFLQRHHAHACTDVSGFGLAGHAAEVAAASKAVRLVVDSAALALLPGTARLAEAGMLTGGAGRTRDHLGARLSVAADVSPVLSEVIVDPQTSGGLLVCLSEKEAPDYVKQLRKRGQRPVVIGRVEPRPSRSRVLVAVE
jgi:selenide,water dikinase